MLNAFNNRHVTMVAFRKGRQDHRTQWGYDSLRWMDVNVSPVEQASFQQLIELRKQWLNEEYDPARLVTLRNGVPCGEPVWRSREQNPAISALRFRSWIGRSDPQPDTPARLRVELQFWMS